MNAVFTPFAVGARRQSGITSVSSVLRPALHTVPPEVLFCVMTGRSLDGGTEQSRLARAQARAQDGAVDPIEGERARRPTARGRGPVEGSGKEPA